MNAPFKSYIFLFIFIIGGCAAQEHSKVTNINSSDYINIDKQILFEGYGKFNSKNIYVTLPGRYQLEKENLKGKFYKGDTLPVGIITNGIVNLWEGGIWIPNSIDESPRIYIYIGDSMIYAKEVDEAKKIRQKLIEFGTDNTKANGIPTFEKNNRPSGAYYKPPATSYVDTLARKTPSIQFSPTDQKFNIFIRSYPILQ